MASRWDRLKSWLGSKPSAEELEQARTQTYAEANRLDPKSLEESNAALRDAADMGRGAAGWALRNSAPGMAYRYMTEDPEAEAELARVAANPIAGPASPTEDQSALLDAQRRLATNPIEGPEHRPEATAPVRSRKRPPRTGTGGSGPAGTSPIRPEVRAYLEKRAAERVAAPAEDEDAELAAAQSSARKAQRLNLLGRAGASFADAIADQSSDNRFWDEADALAKGRVSDVLERRTAAKARKADRQGDEDRARTLALDDPQSEQSKLARELFATKNPTQAKRFGDRLERFSANALAKLEPSIEKELDRQFQLRLRAQDNAAELEKAHINAAKGEATANKDQKKALTEIKDRHKNIKDQIGQLRQMVSSRGTNEFLGGHNKILEQKLTSIATDMAKLVDPNSVARESEVQTFKKMLFEPGLWQRDSSALDVLGSFEQMVDDRLGNAYAVRGIEAPAVAPVKMIDPDGETHNVPANEVAAARRKGLKEA